MSAKKLLLAGLLGGVAAAFGNYLVYFVALAAGVDFVGNFDGHAVGHLSVPLIAMSSIAPGLVGALVLFGMGKAMPRPLRVFVPVSALLAVGSIFAPMHIPGASEGTRIALSAMHVVALVAIVGVIVFRQRAGALVTQ